MHRTDASAEAQDPSATIEKLRSEHLHLKQRLQKLNRSLHLTPAEELEVRQIKHQKLAKKDQILALMQTIAQT